MTAIGDKKVNRWHLQIADRWIVQYNFYISDHCCPVKIRINSIA
jgi:hypothetical protein